MALTAGQANLKANLDRVRQLTQKGRRYKSDESVWGEAEHWETPDEVATNIDGDCDTDALRVRCVLRSLGIKNRLVYCKAGTVGHLVCEVEGWIFDVNYPRVTSRGNLPYEWIAMSGYEPGDPWHVIRN